MELPDTRQLRYFVALAEHLHFGRAAAALHISQPPLSRAIRGLEEQLGARLLTRSKRKVELTAEGARLYDDARRVLGQLERVAHEVGAMAAGQSGRLRLGFVSLADYGVLPDLLKTFKAARPGVSLALREMLSPDQAAALAAGELDFGLLLPPVSNPISGDLEHLVVQSEKFVVAMPSRHALARRSQRIAVRELAAEPFVMVPREIAPGLYDIVAGLAARAGFAPRVAQEAIQMQTVVSLVSSGLGVAMVPSSIANLGRRGVVYREIADAHPRLDVWLAWRGGELAPVAREFLAHARRFAR